MLLKPHHLLPRITSTNLLIRTFPSTPFRAMSTEAPKKIDWLCIMPDQEGALERRIKARPQHFEGIKPLIASGFINFGGAYLDEPPEEGKQMAFRGSVMTCVAESKEAVIEVLKKDPYTAGEVWDWEKAQIFPFKCAVRTALEQ